MQYKNAWLTYHQIDNYQDTDCFKTVGTLSDESSVNVAKEELICALKQLFHVNLHSIDNNRLKEYFNIKKLTQDESSINYTACKGLVILGTEKNFSEAGFIIPKISSEGYYIKHEGEILIIAGGSPKGVLYGVYHVLRHIMLLKPIRNTRVLEEPDCPLRMINHWDNMDGSIERGYAGNSFFFAEENILMNERTKDYARLTASIGINAVVINNVNVKGAASELITDRYLHQLKNIAEIFRDYGITLYLSVNFAAPIEVGELPTADPCNKQVIIWWKQVINHVYEMIPDFGGFLVKADSEHRPGPFTYQRTHADGANMLADALRPYGGKLIWRCFVYNCKQDWRDKSTDRARAAYDNFMPLDGTFHENVILQIKNGPMDFQVREPVSPLFGGLMNTNQILEVQIAQEYTGQQKDLCYLIPMFKEILNFKTYVTPEQDTVGHIVKGDTFSQMNCGMAAVSNTGNDLNWTGHDLAAVNWYGYGRLSWKISLTSEEIAREWTAMTLGYHKKVSEIIVNLLMASWSTYEKYTTPLGIGWMVNPNHHYGPNVNGYEYDRWGTYHRADRNGVGVDRTKTGTAFVTQYKEPNASIYSNKETCPEELLLFFHHMPYQYHLKSGKTLIQHIYDTHFEGVEEVMKMQKSWDELHNLIEEDIYYRVKERFQFQLENAIEWRDQINSYFYRMSGELDKYEREIY